MVAINVLEHIDDDTGALRSLATAVEVGGSLVLWVPGYQQLYGEFDRRVGHVRRYTPSSLARVVRQAGLDVELVKPVNLLGGVAWWLTVSRGGVSSPDPRMVAAFDRWVVPHQELERCAVPWSIGVVWPVTEASLDSDVASEFVMESLGTGASVVAGIISEIVSSSPTVRGRPPVASLACIHRGRGPELSDEPLLAGGCGRPDGTREVLPYAVIVVATALTAIVVTTAADRWARDHVAAHALQVTLVGAAFLATYGTMFVLKFVLFDRFIFVDRPARTPDTTSAP